MTTTKKAVDSSVPSSISHTSTGAGSAGNVPINTTGAASSAATGQSASGNAAAPPGTSSTPTSAATRPLKGLRLKLQQIMSGVEAAIPDGTSLLVAGTLTPKAEVVQQLSAGLTLYTAVEAQETAVVTARQQLTGQPQG